MEALENKIEFSQAAETESNEPMKETKTKLSFKERLTALKGKIFKKPSKKRKAILWGFLIFLVVFMPLFVVWPVFKIQRDVGQLTAEAQGVALAVQAQELDQAVTKIKTTHEAVNRLNRDYRGLIWLRIIPFLGGYYRDGQRLINSASHLLDAADVAVKGLQPYADILGLGGEEKKTMEEMTAEERLLLALDTLDKIEPSLEEIGEKLSLAQEEVKQINLQRYPVKISKWTVREKIASLVETIDSTAKTANEIKPVVGLLRPLLGVPDEKQYLLLFQNDAELRPTGGFMTAYALLSVKKGKFTPGSSFDIYTLDARFGNRVEAPRPIKEYLPNVYYWHLRDMNLSPDFGESMEIFWENAQRVIGSSEIDGIIALDTKVLVDIMEVLGPIGVSGWGNFSAEVDERCNCPQVFYELELYADKPLGTFKEVRKGIIGPLMHSILLNAMGSPRKKWPQFFNIVLSNIQEKHALFYFFDEEIQKGMEALNASAKIKEYEGDYFHLNDCNFAGAKSNMYIQQNILQEIEIANDGTVTKKVTIDYKNPEPPSNCNLEAGELCLNGLYRDWVRLYVPLGSELIKINGSEVEVEPYEELGKTVFEAFYGDESPLRPLGKAQVSFEYKLPFKVTKGSDYSLLIQKQPGTKNHEYQIMINGQEEVFELSGDKELRFSL